MNGFACCPHDYATETRLSRLWVIEHPWLALAYRVVGLAILTASAAGVIAVGWKLAGWVLAWQ
jgi:hypothetical protein